jgi:hypothetical protein
VVEALYIAARREAVEEHLPQDYADVVRRISARSRDQRVVEVGAADAALGIERREVTRERSIALVTGGAEGMVPREDFGVSQDRSRSRFLKAQSLRRSSRNHAEQRNGDCRFHRVREHRAPLTSYWFYAIPNHWRFAYARDRRQRGFIFCACRP